MTIAVLLEREMAGKRVRLPMTPTVLAGEQETAYVEEVVDSVEVVREEMMFWFRIRLRHTIQPDVVLLPDAEFEVLG